MILGLTARPNLILTRVGRRTGGGGGSSHRSPAKTTLSIFNGFHNVQTIRSKIVQFLRLLHNGRVVELVGARREVRQHRAELEARLAGVALRHLAGGVLDGVHHVIVLLEADLERVFQILGIAWVREECGDEARGVHDQFPCEGNLYFQRCVSVELFGVYGVRKYGLVADDGVGGGLAEGPDAALRSAGGVGMEEDGGEGDEEE